MKPGTTLLIRHEGFIPNQIRLHMKVFGRQLRKDYFPEENHAETVVLFKGHLMSVGARKGGAELTPLQEYLKQHPHYKALIPVVDLSQEEIDLMNEGKALAAQCGEFIDKLMANETTDKRAVALGKTNLQQGFMWAIRGVAQPTTF